VHARGRREAEVVGFGPPSRQLDRLTVDGRAEYDQTDTGGRQ
jgi:hypothetical protein